MVQSLDPNLDAVSPLSFVGVQPMASITSRKSVVLDLIAVVVIDNVGEAGEQVVGRKIQFPSTSTSTPFDHTEKIYPTP